MILRSLFAFFGFFLLLTSCAQKQLDYLPALSNYEQFENFAGLPLSSQFNGISSVKVVYSIEKDQFYFFDSRKFTYHYQFAQNHLNEYAGLQEFNDLNYESNPNRKYVLGNLNFNPSSNRFFLEFAASELYSSININFFQKIQQYLPFIDHLELYPGTDKHLQFVTEFYPELSFLSSADLYQELSFQVIYKANACGRLKFVDAENFYFSDFERNDILVFNEIPNEVPICRAVIASYFQTPLSHISLLSKNRKLPCIALKDAYNLEELRKFEGKLVSLKISMNSYEIIEISEVEAQKKWNQERIAKVNVKKYDLGLDQITAIEDLGVKDAKFVGSKAANFAELAKLQKQRNLDFKTPENAFALPFSFYLDYIKRYSLDQLITQLNVAQSNEEIELILAEIRDSIETIQLDQDLLVALNNKMKAANYEAYRFRSSTNAEDVDGFNGAGLYTSKTAFVDDLPSIEKAVLKVWASLWSKNAYNERKYFQIDDELVAMAILIHRSFPDEMLNGVVLTENSYRKEMAGFVINVQKGDLPVVDARDTINCEQLVLYIDEQADTIRYTDYLSFSSLSPKQSLLTSVQLKQIHKAVIAVKRHFYTKNQVYLNTPFEQYVLDLEFKYDKNSTDLYIKQVRPF